MYILSLSTKRQSERRFPLNSAALLLPLPSVCSVPLAVIRGSGGDGAVM